MMILVKITSRRTGKVGYLRGGDPNGRDFATPCEHRSEAGRFATEADADAAIAEFTGTLVRVIGVCRWTITKEI